MLCYTENNVASNPVDNKLETEYCSLAHCHIQNNVANNPVDNKSETEYGSLAPCHTEQCRQQPCS